MIFKRITAVVLSITLLAQLVGCGTILHPQRKGQVDGELDPSIVILDGIGLLFFLVPGVIAFAVDFNNGCIYLPGNRRADVSNDNLSVRRVYVGKAVHDPQVVLDIASEASGRSLVLSQIAIQDSSASTVALY